MTLLSIPQPSNSFTVIVQLAAEVVDVDVLVVGLTANADAVA
jgi:hypothetical protein